MGTYLCKNSHPPPEVVGLREKKPEMTLSGTGDTVKHGPFQGSVPNFGLVIVLFSLGRVPPTILLKLQAPQNLDLPWLRGWLGGGLLHP